MSDKKKQIIEISEDAVVVQGTSDFSMAVGLGVRRENEQRGKECGKERNKKCIWKPPDLVLLENPLFPLLRVPRVIVEAKLYSQFKPARIALGQLLFYKDDYPDDPLYFVMPFKLPPEEAPEILRVLWEYGVRPFRELAVKIAERYFLFTGERVLWSEYEDRMQEKHINKAIELGRSSVVVNNWKQKALR